MKVDIMFHSTSAPKMCDNIDSVYTKGELLCVQHSNGLLMKYPLLNVFSVAQFHMKHLGTTRSDNDRELEEVVV